MVVALIGVGAAIAVPMIEESRKEARNSKASGDIRAIETDIDVFEMNRGSLPSSLEEVGRADMEDPWGRPYIYLPFSAASSSDKIRRDRNLKPLNSNYDLYSVGEDGESRAPLTARASWDDIIRANDGGYVGIATKY